MPTITKNSLSFPDFGWQVRQEDAFNKTWVNPTETAHLSVDFFDGSPDLPTLEDGIDAIRNHYRLQLVAAEGGLIHTDFTDLSQIPALKTIFKIPKQPTGMGYVGALTIPFNECSFVVKIQSAADQSTGVRESTVLQQLMQRGSLTFEGDSIKGWAFDPYDPDYAHGRLMTIPEREQFDEGFPKHPLSLVRRLLATIEQELRFSVEIADLKPFYRPHSD